jgi:hypothetical protein
MKTPILVSIVFALFCAAPAAFQAPDQQDLSLRNLTPENYSYREAARCAGCKGDQNAFMARAAGVNLNSEEPALDSRGWLASIHARSQSHEDGVDTACAFCHAPLTEGATRDKEKAEPIPRGDWQGVTCGACHPGSVEQGRRKSLVANFLPGTDPTDPDNYTFRDREDGAALNAQCRFCHHESHDLKVEKKTEMLSAGELRCIDCHMAAYAQTDGRVERFHNFQVEENLPHSCSGGLGRTMTCHDDTPAEWFSRNLERVKAERKTWSADWEKILKK